MGIKCPGHDGKSRAGSQSIRAALLRRAVDGPGVTIPAYNNLIRNQLSQGSQEGARAALADFAATYPASPGPFLIGFYVHMFAGDEVAAAESIRGLLGMSALANDQLVTGERDLGMIPGLRGRFAEAERHFENAARLAGQKGRVVEEVSERLGVPRRRVLAGDVTTARSQLAAFDKTGLFEAAPADERSWAVMIEDRILTGDRAGAQRYLERWSAESPDEYVTPANRGRMAFLQAWARGGDLASLLQALAVYRRDGLCPRCNRIQEAEWLEATGRSDEARVALREMLTLPENDLFLALASRPWALENLGRLADEAGDKAEAIDAYRRFADLWANADPEFQLRVRHARERIAALGG